MGMGSSFIPFFVDTDMHTICQESFWKVLVALKRAVLYVRWLLFNLRIRRGFCLVSWGRRQHPWLLRSSSWRAQCRWQHLWWRFPRKLSGHHGSLRRWVRRYVWHHLFVQDDGWLAWWYPGYYHATPSCDAWRLLFRVLYLLFLCLTCFWLAIQLIEWRRMTKSVFIYDERQRNRKPGLKMKRRFWLAVILYAFNPFFDILVQIGNYTDIVDYFRFW